MNLVGKKRARNSLVKVANWVEEQNTPGAGRRWLETAMSEFTRLSKINVNHAICKDPKLAKF